jgi:hypothetical protein
MYALLKAANLNWLVQGGHQLYSAFPFNKGSLQGAIPLEGSLVRGPTWVGSGLTRKYVTRVDATDSDNPLAYYDI